MIRLLFEGGTIFTVPMLLLFMANVILVARNIMYINKDRFSSESAARKSVDSVKHIGVILLTLGILGQTIGLYEAFKVIQQGEIDISPALLAGGIRVSSITTLMGLTYFVISYISWVYLNLRVRATSE